jgi:hypothetical protein
MSSVSEYDRGELRKRFEPHPKLCGAVNEMGACGFCLMRLVGMTSYSVYACSMVELQGVIRDTSGHEWTDHADSICPLCFDTLPERAKFPQESDEPSAKRACSSALAHVVTIAEHAADRFLSRGFDVTGVRLSVEQPVSCSLRDFCASAHLIKIGACPPGSSCWSLPWATLAVKDAVKFRLLVQLPPLLPGVKMSTLAVADIHVILCHAPTASEVTAFTTRLDPKRTTRRGGRGGRGRGGGIQRLEVAESAGPMRLKRSSDMRGSDRDTVDYGLAQVMKHEEGARVSATSLTGADLERSLHQVTGELPWELQGLCPPPPPTECMEQWLAVRRDSVFISGRYHKIARGVAQTEWLLKGQEGRFPSVESCVGEHVVARFGGTRCRFHSAGREDVDVRMLGGGRPFLLEVTHPRFSTIPDSEMEALTRAVNSSDSDVVVTRLSLVDKSAMDSMAAGAENKRKQYAALVHTRRAVTAAELRSKLDSVRELEVLQDTPGECSWRL